VCIKFRQSILTSTYFGAVCIEMPNPVFRQAIFISAYSDGTYTLYFQAKYRILSPPPPPPKKKKKHEKKKKKINKYEGGGGGGF